jgi:G3E family GTPase
MDSLCKSRLRLDGVLAVVDAVNLKYHLGLGDGVRGNALGAAAHPAIGRGEKKENEVIKQLAYADRVVLNKVDLLSAAVGAADRSVEESLEEIKRAIEVINPRVAVLPCSRGNVPISELLDINAFDALKSGEMLLNAEFCQPINITRLNSRSKKGGKVGDSPKITKNFNSKQLNPSLGMPNLMRLPSKSRNVVQTCSLIVQSPLSLDAVNVWLLSLLQTSGEDVYRIKGILDVADHPEQFVVQGVHMMFDGGRGRLWRPEETRKSVLVFIGVKLDEFQLQQEFDACTVRSLEEAKQKK